MTERFDEVLAKTYEMEDELVQGLDEGRLAIDTTGLDKLHRDLHAHHTELKHLAHKWAEDEPHNASKWHEIAKAHGRKAYMHKIALMRLESEDEEGYGELITELSRGKLAHYVRSASRAASASGYINGFKDAEGDFERGRKEHDYRQRRRKGIEMATKKLERD